MEDYQQNKVIQNRKRVKKCYYKRLAKRPRSTPILSSISGLSSNAFVFNNDQPPINDFNNFSSFDHLKELFPGSDVKYGEFIKILVTLLEQIHSSNVLKDRLIKFINAILPRDNLCPKSYYLLKQELEISHLKLAKRQYVCVSCNTKISKDELCKKPECQQFRTKKVNQTRIDPYFVTNNYVSHFKRVINKNWSLILAHKAEMAKTASITDLCNANVFNTSKEITNNSIAIIIFVDEAEMTPTAKENNLYVILGLIMNLPLRARSSHFNILNFMFWGGYIVNFNNLFQYFEPHFDSFFNQFIEINSNLTVLF